MRIKNLFKMSSLTSSLKAENNVFFKLIGLLHSVALMFGNEMLFCSWFFSSLFSSLLLVLLLDGVLNHLPPLLRVPTQVCSGLLKSCSYLYPVLVQFLVLLCSCPILVFLYCLCHLLVLLVLFLLLLFLFLLFFISFILILIDVCFVLCSIICSFLCYLLIHQFLSIG